MVQPKPAAASNNIVIGAAARGHVTRTGTGNGEPLL
jgi:hypothetical protein